jgi:cytochrome oxidase Cu insertion factor (SCO1/SenC/PrrC family)
MPARSQAAFALAVLAIALAIAAAAFYFSFGGSGPMTSGTALVGGPFSLVDQDGRRVTEKDFLGKYMLVFFGFTYCPDVCPTELQVMSAALDELGTAGNDIQPVFVSIDPERDTPVVVKQYVQNFHPRLMGLTGSAEEIATIARAYRVYYKKATSSATSGDYELDHSTTIYLMDREGRFRKHFGYTTDAKGLAQDLREAISN